MALLFRPEAWLIDARAISQHTLLQGPTHEVVANRECMAVTLQTPGKAQPYRLWIDEATGIRLRCEARTISVVIDDLIFGKLPPTTARKFGILDEVPDVSYTPIHPPPELAAPYLTAARTALGERSAISILSFSETGSFTMLIESKELGHAIFDRRPSGHSPAYQSTKGKSLAWGSESWDYSLDVEWDYTQAHEGRVTEDALIATTKKLTAAIHGN